MLRTFVGIASNDDVDGTRTIKTGEGKHGEQGRVAQRALRRGKIFAIQSAEQEKIINADQKDLKALHMRPIYSSSKVAFFNDSPQLLGSFQISTLLHDHMFATGEATQHQPGRYIIPAVK